MDDISGELIRNEKEELRVLFIEAYKLWRLEALKVSRLLANPQFIAPMGSFNSLDQAWKEYTQLRDLWVGFRWGIRQ